MQQKTKKGSVLAYTIIVLSLLLMIAINIATSTIKQRQSSITTTKSVQAIQIADGAAQLLQKAFKNGNPTQRIATLGGCVGGRLTGGLSGGTYAVISYDDVGNTLACNARDIGDVRKIRVVGTFGAAARAVEVPVQPCAGSVEDRNFSTNSLTYDLVYVPGNNSCWLDKNLGATTDDVSLPASYGWYFQWGREGDGHQIYYPAGSPPSPENNCATPRNPNEYYNCTLSNASNNLSPGVSTFYKTGNTNSSDWLNGHDITLWQGTNGVNNPCPEGFHVPTFTNVGAPQNATNEWGWYMQATGGNSLASFGSSVLNLPIVAGFRNFTDQYWATTDYAGRGGGSPDFCYWSSTLDSNTRANALMKSGTSVGRFDQLRALGCSVRCIRD